MLKKNILGIIMIILIIGAFGAGYFVGRGSVQVPDTQQGRPAQSGQKMAESPPGEQPAGSPQADTKAPEDQQPAQGQPSTEGATMDQPSPEAPSDASQTATPAPLAHTFYGTVAASDEANVQSKQGGTITVLKAKEGDTVRKGAVIVRFDDSDTQLELERANSSKNSALQQVQQAESDFNTVQANFERTRKLFEDGLVSKQEMDSMTNQLESARAGLNTSKESVTQAEAQIKLIQNSLKNFQIAAPISGIIDSKNYNLGEVYQAGSVIYHLINIDQVYVEVDIPEVYIGHIKEQMTVTVSIDALDDQEFSGVIDTILPSGTANNRTFIVKVLVKNPGQKIKPGMFARMDVVLEDS